MAVPTVATPPALVKVKVKGQGLISPLKDKVEELDITSDETYQEADQILAGIRHARKAWAEMIEPVLAPLRQAKTAADKLNRDIDRPMEELEAKVKAAMRDYKIAEAEEIRRQAAIAAKAQAKLTQQLEETAAQEAKARTAPMRERLAQRREAIETRLEETVEDVPAPVKAASSTTRTIPKWRAVDKDAIIRGVLEGKIPAEAIILDFPYVNKVHLTNRKAMESWPGFELYDDIQIAGR